MMLERRRGSGERQGERRAVAEWGWLSPALVERLRTTFPRDVAEVQLHRGSTTRSFGLAILSQVGPSVSRRGTASRIWEAILTPSACRLKLLIVYGAEQLDPSGVKAPRSSFAHVLDALTALLQHGVPFVVVGPKTGIRLLLQDDQLHARFRGDWSRAAGLSR
jgi:hypothetical protein